MSFNFIDFILIAIVLLNVANGFRRGFILGVLELIRWIGGFILAIFAYQNFADVLKIYTDVGEIWAEPLAFILLILGFGLFIYLISRQIVGQMSPEIHQNKFNRILGMLPGFANGLILASVFSSMFFAMPISGEFDNSMQESFLADSLATQTSKFEDALEPIFEDAVNETLTRRLTRYPGSDELVELPFKVTNYKPRPDLEAGMLKLVNKERVAVGLSPVKADEEMRGVARKHSADMFRRGYFSHYTPEEKSPFERMKDDGVRFRTAGENLAIAPTLKIAHTGLMNSPGHRANILQPKFGRLGIGILDGGKRGLMITQNFRN